MGGAGAGGRLRLLFLLVLLLASLEYLGSFLVISPLRTYLYTPIYNVARPFVRFAGRSAGFFGNGGNRFHTLNIVKKVTISEPRLRISSKNVAVTLETVTKTLKMVNEITANVTESNEVFYETPEEVVTTKFPQRLCRVTSELLVLRRPQPWLARLGYFANEVHFDRSARAVPVNLNITMDEIKSKFPELQKGGRYTPPNCTAEHKVAIIVPFRNRQEHLAIFLNHMHPFLMTQQIEYGIFVIEQEGNNQFNRAKLFNVGYVEAQRLNAGGWHCFIFHDVDLLPVDSRNLYTCPRQPRHMSASIDYHKYRLPYNDIFGGVSALTDEQFTNVNGFSNKFWGWGGEDDDMYRRIKNEGYDVGRYGLSIARYIGLPHRKSIPNPKRYKLLSKTSGGWKPVEDGLTTLRYQVVSVEEHHLYTYIRADIDERKDFFRH